MWCDLVLQGCQCGVTWLNRGVTFLTDRCGLVVQGRQCGVTWSYRGVSVV